MTDQELLQAIRAIVKEEAHIAAKEEIHPVHLLLESEIWPAIQKLSEGHDMILERIDEKIERRTEQLQDQLDVHQAAIMRINREIQELNKAQ